jgi:type VI protein secretion system component VasF
VKKKTFEEVHFGLIVPESEWVHASLRTVPPGVIELVEAYQAAAYRLMGAGYKPNRAEAMAWIVACALTDGKAMEKIHALNQAYLEKQRAALAV